MLQINIANICTYGLINRQLRKTKILITRIDIRGFIH